ncbi:hypothetical protein RND81_02G189600 [Saponaria officinalis]|uniref:Cyclin-D1-binding protein 1 n=1 Tax=Saponaria officinalis TaxID=3572 RepID=A0AAW1MS35_SAPOF
MGKADMERLNIKLSTFMSDIHDTLQILDQTPASSLQKGSWVDVINMGEQLSKQATVAGMLFTEERTEVKHLEENMGTYFNVLQGLLLHAYGSTVGAGPTLTSNIHASIKQAVDCSFMLWRESVSYYGSRTNELKLKVPQRVGTVWEACSALKKTPATNIVAIGRAMTQVAVSMKDVLREMKELQPCSSDEKSETESQNLEESISAAENDDGDDDDDFGKDLTPEEMKIANLAIQIVSEIVLVIKELIRSITLLLKTESFNENDSVESLEKLLKLSRDMGAQVDELGACLYPPQEHSAISTACEKISNLADEMSKILGSIKGLTDAFSKSCNALEKALEMLRAELSEDSAVEAIPQNSSSLDVVAAMQDLSVQG